jgi:hypothetical protein
MVLGASFSPPPTPLAQLWLERLFNNIGHKKSLEIILN